MKNFLHYSIAALVAALAIAVAAVAVPFSLLPSYRPATFATGVLMDLPAFDNVVATGVATCKMDNVLGRTVDRIVLGLAGGSLTKTMLTSLRLLANEKVIFESTGLRTDDRMEYRGITAAAGFLTLDFNEIRAHDDMNKRAGGIDTISSGIKKLVLEATITGATTPALTGQAMVSESPQSNNALYNALIAKVLNRTQNFAAAGEFPMALNFVRDPRSYVKRVHLFGSTVTAARVAKTDLKNIKREIFKATDAQNDFIQTEHQRVPQANVFTIDFMPDGDVREALPLGDVLAMEWLVTVSGAGNVIMETELLDPLENN